MDEKGYFQNLRKGLLISALVITIFEVALVILGIPWVQYRDYFKMAINGTLALFGLAIVGLSSYNLFRSREFWKHKKNSRTAKRVRRRSQVLGITAGVAFGYIMVAIIGIALGLTSPWQFYGPNALFDSIL